MNKVSGSSGSSNVSRSRPSAEPKVERSSTRSEAPASAPRATQVRDEFVGSTSRSGAKSPVATAKALPLAQKQEAAAPAAQQQALQSPGDMMKGIVDTIRGLIDKIFGGGTGGTENGAGEGPPVVQSPGKDQLAQGGGGNGVTAG